jgi:hypothetical protein
MRIAIALLALGLATTGCKKKENKPAEPTGSGSAMAGSGSDMGSGSAAMAGSGSAMAGSGSDMGSGSAAMAGSGSAMAGSGADTSMAHHAGNCPSTVFGSTTKAEVKGKDIVVTISATDKDAIKSIQTRTDELIKERMAKKPGEGSAGAMHDQKGTHGGSIGICPVHIPEGATAKAKHDKGGVTVTITPKDKLDDLKKEIDERITKADAWVKENIKPGEKGNQGAVGGGKGEHGANHSGEGDSKGQERKKEGKDGAGGGKGTGGGGGKGTGGGSGSGSAKK